MSEYQISVEPKVVPLVKTAHRDIGTAIPAPGTSELIESLAHMEPKSMHAQLPIVWDSAEGHSVFDSAGNKWIDFTSTIFVSNIGHSNPELLAVLHASLDAQLLHSYTYPTQIRAEYTQKLIDFVGSPFEKAFLLSSGTEAVEAAIKLMRMNGKLAGKRRQGIICFDGNYHGRTLGAQLATGNSEQKSWAGDTCFDVHHIPFPYPWEVNEGGGAELFQRAIEQFEEQEIDPKDDIAGILLETFQGWGAVFYPQDYVKAVEEFCVQNEILLAFDEMQAGFARTGKKFGFEHYSVTPDLICCGKGMGGGVPLSGVIGRAEVLDIPDVGDMSSTHSANPLCCAAGMETIRIIEELDLVSEADRKGRLLFSGLEDIKRAYPGRISRICGHGLIASMHTENPKTGEPDSKLASKISERCMQKGVLVVHTGRESIKLGPPLTISDDALEEGVSVIAEAVQEVVGDI
ncbi:MAG: aminotransferase class III-fold pyridoxal phosphate-dependent enzyme [Alphaproteobacteria bacterium]|nr:aminotransferase class III-fold pyridoxal phosphate-dependent enzyme [Alphaproteobacteria bacterium]